MPQLTEREHIGDQIDAAMIFARADCVKVDNGDGAVSLKECMSKECTAFRKMCEAKWQWHLLNVKMNTIFIFSLIILLFGVDLNSHHESN